MMFPLQVPGGVELVVILIIFLLLSAIAVVVVGGIVLLLLRRRSGDTSNPEERLQSLERRVEELESREE